MVVKTVGFETRGCEKLAWNRRNRESNLLIAVVMSNLLCHPLLNWGHWRRSLLGRAGRGPPTFWLLWAAPISGLPTFLGDVNFFFLYIAIMTGEKLRLNLPRMPQMAV